MFQGYVALEEKYLINRCYDLDTLGLSRVTILIDSAQWHKQEKNFRVFKVMAGIVGGPGGEAPWKPEIFENLQKDLLRKLQKYIILAYFSR